ncbi:hypothetical protein BLNAU_17492 [Blattamonas nauphoetae]|uniref:Uncharacterized protein n=1 Tax=Blattamonas nauphoetae TaxID=2049346 RepID=A0ABQ9X786_9EUKA|nr:hypothetical protein BLNAU_17492 [Blattamonas nauphoetae]
MPPKHKLGRKRNQTQLNPRKTHSQSSNSNSHVVHSTIPSSLTIPHESVLDTHVVPFPTDVLTTADDDKHYVRISKQILQSELKRKRMNADTISEQALLEGNEIALTTSTTSDWRLVLQNSVTTDDLRQGCISLVDQVNSGIKLTPIEVYHASRFLGYAEIHIEHCGKPKNQLIESLFPAERLCQTKVTSALIKLVCHPSDTLRTVALSFFDISLRYSTGTFSTAMAATGQLPQLFDQLKPLEVPLTGTTIQFHRHLISIVDDFFTFCPHRELSCQLRNKFFSTNAETLASEILGHIFQQFCTYLQYLLAHPVCPSDLHSGISLISNMRLFNKHVTRGSTDFADPNLEPIFGGMRKNMIEDFGEGSWMSELPWVETVERLLVRMSQGWKFSDLGVQAFLCLMNKCPNEIKPIFWSESKFSMELKWDSEDSLELPTQTLCALFTPARPHHATAILSASHIFVKHLDCQALVRMIQNGWFSAIFEVVSPSTLPFAAEFESLHTQLVKVLKECLVKIGQFVYSHKLDQDQSELDDIYRSFHNQTNDYFVHLSHHPFAFIHNCFDTPILDFFIDLFRYGGATGVRKRCQDELRQAMDESTLSSSSPPFILTSEIVCDLTEDEIMNVVDRIVALMESDSRLDDDTILRICAFHKNRLQSVYLPELFRKAGRSKEQFFHVLESLLSLPVESFYLTPIRNLLNPKPDTLPPTFDEWDDVDLETVGVVTRMISQNLISSRHATWQLLSFAVETLSQLSICATRLTPSRLEQLITPSINLISKEYFEPFLPNSADRDKRDSIVIKISELCDQRVIIQCLSRIGIFSRFVTGLMDHTTSFQYGWMLEVLMLQATDSNQKITKRKKHQVPIPHCLEEGWQDILDFLLIQKDRVFDRSFTVREMMHFNGANLRS